jgi:hypothetical protein
VVGQLVQELRGLVRFGEGSGLIELGNGTSDMPPQSTGTRDVRIVAMARSQLPEEAAAVLDDDVPCILGHSGEEVVVLVGSRSLARVSGGLGDLRGKIKFGLAKIGWIL